MASFSVSDFSFPENAQKKKKKFQTHFLNQKTLFNDDDDDDDCILYSAASIVYTMLKALGESFKRRR